uniref:Uncharacterized protein n=1 Tax=Lutzomyia longipalpis TaxID=7200 RepID=A0A1B0GLA1_LUTLO
MPRRGPRTPQGSSPSTGSKDFVPTTHRPEGITPPQPVTETDNERQRMDLLATTLSMKYRTRIGTWNVLTLAQQGKLAQLAREAVRLKVEILGLCEVRWPNYGEQRLLTGQVLLYSGPQGENAPRERGVGILLSSQAHAALLRWNPVSDRIIVARFRTRARNLTLVQCYAPTDVSDLPVKEGFYSELDSVLRKVPKGDIVILQGDFNAKLGSDNTDYERIMGRHCAGEMSENGELLAEACVNNDLAIGGSLFPHKLSHKVTWVSRDGHTENQIDHICISRKWRRSLLDVRNKRSADIASDHHLLIAEVRLRVARVNRKQEKVGKRFNTRRLESSEVREAFSQNLRSRVSTLPAMDSVEQQWNGIKTAFIETGESVLGVLRTKRKCWISDETWEKVVERKEAKARVNNARTRSAKAVAQQRYEELQKDVKKSCRRDRRAWTNNLAKEGEKAAANGDMRLLYDISRRLSGAPVNCKRPLKDKTGNLLTNPEDQLKRWFEHFEQLLQAPQIINNQTPQGSGSGVRRINRVNTRPPSLDEVRLSILSMKSGKAPGIDRISSEMLKTDIDTSAQLLHRLFATIWETATFPSDWLQGILVKVPKKGDPTVCDNWRGIMLLCTALKVLCKVILGRIQEKIDNTLRRQQAGFRAGRSCVDHIATLRVILEQVSEFHESLHMVFVDYEKAFDRIDHGNLWDALRRKGVPENLVGLIKAQYDSFVCRVLHDGVLSDPIRVVAGAGVHLVSAALSHLICRQADDLSSRSGAAGLKINVGKTKSLSVNAPASSFTVAGQVVENVEAFQYLGSQITSDGGAKTDVQTRIRKARGAFACLRGVWRSPHLSLRTKLRIFNSNVKSVLLYACETWCPSSDTIRRLQTFVNRCLRNIIRAWWPHNWISNRDLHVKCDQRPIELEIRERKWRWIGHTLRKPADEICREALDWNPQGARRRGRPRGTWRRSLFEEVGTVDSSLSWPQVRAMAGNRQ